MVACYLWKKKEKLITRTLMFVANEAEGLLMYRFWR